MSYETYKFLHLISLFLFTSSATVHFIVESPKFAKMILGITTLLVLVSGMGLLARIGVSHGDGFPAWVIGKMVIWLVLGAGVPILSKRLHFKANKILMVAFFALVGVAAYLAINHG